KIRLGAECIAFEKRGDKVAVQVDCSSGDKTVIGSHTLFAVGRVPNTNDLGLERAGIGINERGYIQVDDQLRTNVPGIYALGDCNGRGAFTHTAYNDYEIVASNLLDGDERQRAIQCNSARHAHSSDCHRIDPDHARRVEAVGVTAIVAISGTTPQ